MNQTSINMMKEIVDEYELSNKVVVDMGSYDINGTYKALFTKDYIGVDIIRGPNVDVLVGSHLWNCLKDVDAVISGQTIEHIADVPAFMSGIMRILKPGGILCIIAPSDGPGHDYPIFTHNYPEPVLRKAIEDGGFEFISAFTDEELPFKLCRCVARKPGGNVIPKLKRTIKKEEED